MDPAEAPAEAGPFSPGFDGEEVKQICQCGILLLDF
jgi:hypothetical protein